MSLLQQPETARAEAPPATPQSAPRAASIEGLLETRPPRWRRARGVVLGGAALVALLVVAIWFWGRMQAQPSHYVTTPVRRGDLTVVVTTTGALAPVNQVDVGSELSGTVDQVLVEENDHVRRGQVLAVLDTARLRDQIAQNVAAVATARAGLAQAQATVRETSLAVERKHRLAGPDGFVSRADVDAAEAALARARAAEASARAAIAQAQAALNTSRTNLAKAVIRSPVDGVVLLRKVEVGQTVAAALQAPVLFTLAEDMRRMELDVDVDEADVGQVRDGQSASFTVDAWPNREYAARVTRVDYGSQTKEGVVTYTAVLTVDNADLSLRPGMTASADIRTDQRTGVLLVPDAALRFTPSQPQKGASLGSALVPRMPRIGAGPQRRSTDPNAQQVWVLKDDLAVARPVRVGASDGRDTEVLSGLAPGEGVITGEAERRR